MQKFNLIIVFNKERNKVLMCFRDKKPYKGLYNFVGGKIEPGENYLESAYRELLEETGINCNDIKLKPFMNFVWHPFEEEMLVYIGALNGEVDLIEEAHKLFWFDINEDFFDMHKFAGEGNIGHMIEIYKREKDKIFNN